MSNAVPDQSSGDLAKLQSQPHAVAAWQSAQQLLIQGRHVAALNAYRAMVKQFPGVAGLWTELAIAAAGNLDFALARDAFGKAALLAANDPDLLVTIGQQYHRLRRLVQASAAFEQAAAADPSSVHAQLSLAAWLERNRQIPEAMARVEECLKQNPREERARYFRAFLLHRQNRHADAESQLRDLLQAGPSDPDVKISAGHLLATVLDATAQYPEAMRTLLEAKSLLRQRTDTAALEKTYDKMDAARREILAALTRENIQRWQENADTTGPTPALLAGPPRSGTTLIEQILGAHREILVFDEPESFAVEVLNTLAPVPPAKPLTLKALNTLTASTRAALVRRYERSLLRELDQPPAARTWLDKNPSLTQSLHLWLRIFPKSKVIITLRDPRDIIISCLFQNLALTPHNVNFLSAARTVKYYADSMDVWLRLRDLGGFSSMETRYEDMVNQLESEGRRVTEFLGHSWNDAQSKFHEVSRSKFVFAPTYSDVTRPVYQRALRRWEHYADTLEPLQSALAPYCRAFSYTD